MPALRTALDTEPGTDLRRPAPGRAPWGTPRQGAALGSVVALALALRVAWSAYATRPPVSLIDPLFYGLFAERIADGEGYTLPAGEATAYYPVGYPGTLAGLVWLGQRTPLPDATPSLAAGLNIVLGVALVVLVFVLGRSLHGPRVGIVAAAIVAVWPNLIFHSAVALSELLFMVLLLGALVVAVSYDWGRGGPGTARLLLFGLLLGLSLLVRPISPLVVVALGLAWLAAGRAWRPALRDVVVAGVVAVAVLVPWAVRNTVVMEAPVALSTNLGDNLCIGRNDDATGAFTLAPACFEGFDGLERPEYETRRNADNTSRAVRYAVGHPVDELRLLFWRSFWTMHHDHDGLSAAESYGADQFISDRMVGVLELVSDGWYFAVLALAVVGARRLGLREDPRRLFVLLSGLSLFVAPLVFFGDARFHVPVLPFLAVWAAVALVRLVPGVLEARRVAR